MRQHLHFLVLLIPLVVSCTHAPERAPQADESSVVLSLQSIDCESCGAEAQEKIEKLPGVGKMRFDRDRAELTIAYDKSKVSEAQILKTVTEGSIQAVVGAGKGSYLEDIKFPEAADVKWISKAGEDVDVSTHLATAKVTVVDFYAKWCGPCCEVDKEMLVLLEGDKGLALRKVNVVDWNTPVTKRYRIPNLPYIMVYGTDSKIVDKISGLELERLRKAIQKGKLK